jgi:hypothetical protein
VLSCFLVDFFIKLSGDAEVNRAATPPKAPTPEPSIPSEPLAVRWHRLHVEKLSRSNSFGDDPGIGSSFSTTVSIDHGVAGTHASTENELEGTEKDADSQPPRGLGDEIHGKGAAVLLQPRESVRNLAEASGETVLTQFH